jgi:hypothetical protein
MARTRQRGLSGGDAQARPVVIQASPPAASRAGRLNINPFPQAPAMPQAQPQSTAAPAAPRPYTPLGGAARMARDRIMQSPEVLDMPLPVQQEFTRLAYADAREKWDAQTAEDQRRIDAGKRTYDGRFVDPTPERMPGDMVTTPGSRFGVTVKGETPSYQRKAPAPIPEHMQPGYEFSQSGNAMVGNMRQYFLAAKDAGLSDEAAEQEAMREASRELSAAARRRRELGDQQGFEVDSATLAARQGVPGAGGRMIHARRVAGEAMLGANREVAALGGAGYRGVGGEVTQGIGGRPGDFVPGGRMARLEEEARRKEQVDAGTQPAAGRTYTDKKGGRINPVRLAGETPPAQKSPLWKKAMAEVKEIEARTQQIPLDAEHKRQMEVIDKKMAAIRQKLENATTAEKIKKLQAETAKLLAGARALDAKTKESQETDEWPDGTKRIRR